MVLTARLIVNQGLQVIGQRATDNTPPPEIQTMALDNATAVTSSFLATHTALSNAAAATQIATALFSATSTTAQTVQHFSLFGTAAANFQIGRVSLHNSATPTLSSASLIGGIDQQSLTKTTDFTLQVEIDITYSSI